MKLIFCPKCFDRQSINNLLSINKGKTIKGYNYPTMECVESQSCNIIIPVDDDPARHYAIYECPVCGYVEIWRER